MKVLVVHNYYGDHAQGGESVVFEQEVSALKARGVETRTYTRTNAELERASLWRKARAFALPARSPEVEKECRALMRDFRPDVVHVHNYKYVVSPAVLKIAKEFGSKTVLTLHNYRLVVPCGQFRRGNALCEECLTRSPTRSLWRDDCASSLRGRILQSAYFFRARKPALRYVDAYFALSPFGRAKFVQGGLPAEKVFVKRNFLPDAPLNATRERGTAARREAIFIGRLSPEKGVRFMLDAWRDVDFPLAVVGAGSELDAARSLAGRNVSILGALPREAALERLRTASFLVFPSLWYEGAPMVLIEACALGVPILTSRAGDRADVVERFDAGLTYDLGDRYAFVESADRMASDPSLLRRLSVGSRAAYDALWRPEPNIERTLRIYQALIDEDHDALAELRKGE